MTDETPKELAERKILLAVGDASLAIWEICKLSEDQFAFQVLTSSASELNRMRNKLDVIIAKIELREAA